MSSRKSRVTGQLTDGSRVKKCDPLSYLTITASRRSEVARAIRQTASRKATGPDDVPAELFKAGETVLDRMHRICVAIWETGEWPEEWTFSTFIPLPTKGDLKQCANYRTIAVVSYASKILRIILRGGPKKRGHKLMTVILSNLNQF